MKIFKNILFIIFLFIPAILGVLFKWDALFTVLLQIVFIVVVVKVCGKPFSGFKF